MEKNSRAKHTYRSNPPTNLDKFIIAKTAATQNYIKVITPCRINKPVTNFPQVILPEEILIQSTRRSDLNLKPLIIPIDSISHI